MRWRSMRDGMVLTDFLFIPLSFPILFVLVDHQHVGSEISKLGRRPYIFLFSFLDQLLLLYPLAY